VDILVHLVIDKGQMKPFKPSECTSTKTSGDMRQEIGALLRSKEIINAVDPTMDRLASRRLR